VGLPLLATGSGAFLCFASKVCSVQVLVGNIKEIFVNVLIIAAYRSQTCSDYITDRQSETLTYLIYIMTTCN
jgi:hypothetical protein